MTAFERPAIAPEQGASMAAFDERCMVFSCKGERLLGLVATPAAHMPRSGVGVLVIVGGPQYRVGSHRQFVQLSRALARGGHAVMRFDVRGMGDSSGPLADFTSLTEDIQAGIQALRDAEPGVDKVVLMGLCDGASAALMAVRRVPRVQGLCLLNPWARSEEGLARTQVKHYYLRRLGSLDFWRKLAAGGVGSGALRAFAAALRAGFFPGQRAEGNSTAVDDAGDFRVAMLQGCQAFRGDLLLALSGDDLTAREFADHVAGHSGWQSVLTGPRVRRLDLAGADHTLSQKSARLAFEQAALDWLQRLATSKAA